MAPISPKFNTEDKLEGLILLPHRRTSIMAAGNSRTSIKMLHDEKRARAKLWVLGSQWNKYAVYASWRE
jgi:hypothetical protein